MVDAAWSETALGNFKSTPFAQQNVRGGYPRVVEDHFAMAMRRIVIAVNTQGAKNLHAFSVDGDQNHRLLRMSTRVVGVALTHDDHDFAARVTRTTDPPLASGDDVLVAIALDSGFDVGGIARGDRGFSHRER